MEIRRKLWFPWGEKFILDKNKKAARERARNKKGKK